MARPKRPAPLVDASVDLGPSDHFPLYFHRLRKSKWWRRASHLARSTNVMLWCEAYQQIPAGSMPDDDDELAEAAGFGLDVEGFVEVKDEVMAPWVLCSDGRWYHPTVCEVAMERWNDKSAKRKADAERKRQERERLKAMSQRRPNVSRVTDLDGAHVTDTEETEQNTTNGTGHRSSLRSESSDGSDAGNVVVLSMGHGAEKSAFDRCWAAYPVKGRKRSGTEAGRKEWPSAVTACAKILGVGRPQAEEALATASLRFDANPETHREAGRYIPGFHRFLKMGTWANYLTDEQETIHDTGTGPDGRQVEHSARIRDAFQGLHDGLDQR